MEYVGILHLAASTMASMVDSALSLLLEAGQPVDYAQVAGPGRAQTARGPGTGPVRKGGPDNL